MSRRSNQTEIELGVAPGERLAIAGRTGTGKSVLACYFACRSASTPWIVLNPKGTKAYESLGCEVLETVDLQRIEKLLRAGRWIDLRPPVMESADPQKLDDVVLNLQMNFRGFGLIIDELYTLHRNGQAGPGLSGLLTRGRELQQSVIMCTQRPRWVSRFVFSEAEKFAVLDLNLGEDRKAVRDATGREEFLKRPQQRHGWFFYVVPDDVFIPFGPVAPPVAAHQNSAA